MRRRHGVLDAFPGRVTVRYHVPDELLVEAERIAAERGVDRAVALGDLVAEVLPDALAEAARDVLAPEVPSDAVMPPALTDGITSNPKVPQPQVTPSIAPGDLHAEDAPGAET